ncbi:hypothetical protein VQH23_09175 [Pararoseomonas sp. SCSIO 73927]|uniref:hypothetical protein n=1 Tax=Pararoseomonas sp. SCSIO 73927 TaxID=3114537 RepID=UPI0030D6117E
MPLNPGASHGRAVALALIALLASCLLPASAAEPAAAELRVLVPGEAVMRARIEREPDGYRLVIRCESGCPAPVEHAESFGDVPLGLFQLWDGDGLLLSTWAATSVYVVRAHLLTPRGVRPVLEATSRGAPGVALDGRGRMTVTTSERLGGARDGLRTVAWRWDGARFRRGGG